MTRARWFIWERGVGVERPLHHDVALDHWFALVLEVGDRAFVALSPVPTANAS